ncbi:MAG: ABC transporter permease subunit [Solirubrobacterales bacterium]|nr:ABC transporter permease subunit [Solirubrobacterales bacterium]
MSAAARHPDVPATATASPTGAVGRVFATERRKLTAQLSTRLLAVVCLAGPFAFAGILKVQSGTPSDSLLGVYVHSSGFAIPLVVLAFAGSWGFPLVAGVLCGDMFSSEDRYGTWKTVLTRSCTRGELFAGKLLAAMTFMTALVALVAVASVLAGVLLVGGQSLVGLGGALISPGHALALVLLSFLICLPAVLAYTSLAVLLSVATRNGIIGVIGPIMVALATQLIDLIGKGVIVHMLMVGSAFNAWTGLLTTTRPFFGPLIVSIGVSLAWIAASVAAAWRLVRSRDFAGTAVGARVGWVAPVRTVAIVVAVIAALALATDLGPVGITRARLTASMAPEFNQVTLLQQQLIGRAVPPDATFYIKPNCFKRAAVSVGPGDWTCTMNVFLPRPGRVAFERSPVDYDVSVASNGCYKAQSPPAFIGGQTMPDARGRSVVNPLYIVYGCFNVL